MRTLFLTLWIGFIYVFPLHAQQKLSDITAPSSPASALLDVQPQAVLTPKSYRALETALYSNFLNSSGEGVIPNDFALEFTPYWTKDRSLSIQEYLYPKNVWKGQVVRNSSFSMATTQNFQLGDSTATSAISLGYRTTLYFGNKQDREVVETQLSQIRENKRIQTRIGAPLNRLALDDNIQSKAEFIQTSRSIIFSAISRTYPSYSSDDVESLVNLILADAASLPAYDVENPDDFLDAFMNMIDEKLSGEELFQTFKSYIKDRQGFSVDIAYGIFMNFPGSNFKSAVAPRQSVWITPSYRFKDKWNKLQVMGVFRYEGYDTNYYKTYFPTSEVFENNLDFGLAVSGEFDRFSMQFEAVGRSSNSLVPAGIDNQGNELFRKDSRSDFQAIGTFVYRLTDQLALAYSLGDRFDPIINSNNTLVSLLSLNFGFGSPTRDDLDL